MSSSLVVVLKTGRVDEWNLAKSLLEAEGIPSCGQEHSVAGLVTAMQGAPTPGPGVSFALLVSEETALKAAEFLDAAGLSPGTEPDMFHYGSDPRMRAVARWVVLAVLAAAALVTVLECVQPPG